MKTPLPMKTTLRYTIEPPKAGPGEVVTHTRLNRRWRVQTNVRVSSQLLRERAE